MKFFFFFLLSYLVFSVRKKLQKRKRPNEEVVAKEGKKHFGAVKYEVCILYSPNNEVRYVFSHGKYIQYAIRTVVFITAT